MLEAAWIGADASRLAAALIEDRQGELRSFVLSTARLPDRLRAYAAADIEPPIFVYGAKCATRGC
jgi:hypothetical protein